MSNSMRKKNSGTKLRHSSPHRERVCIHPISGEHASNIERESSVTVQLEGSHTTINGLKRSEEMFIRVREKLIGDFQNM